MTRSHSDAKGVSVPTETEAACVANLRTHQMQLDADGCMVGVSRQALDETLAIYDGLLGALKGYDNAFADFDPECRDSRFTMRKAVMAARAMVAHANPKATGESAQ